MHHSDPACMPPTDFLPLAAPIVGFLNLSKKGSENQSRSRCFASMRLRAGGLIRADRKGDWGLKKGRRVLGDTQTHKTPRTRYSFHSEVQKEPKTARVGYSLGTDLWIVWDALD